MFLNFANIIPSTYAKMSFATVVVALLAASVLVAADTPANCLYEDLRGTWLFYKGPAGQTNAVDCSADVTVDSVATVTLTYPDVASDGADKGFFTIIYNQGFEVVVSGVKYFAFSKYTKDASGNVTSFCDTTFNGWYHNADGTNWGCYYGRKIASTSLDGVAVRATPMRHGLSEEEKARPYVPDLDFVRRINSAQSLWVADAYEKEYAGMTIGDLHRRAGGSSASVADRSAFHATAAAAKKVEPARGRTSEVIPKSFDWRNVDGVNYVSPVRDQGSCGSCYAFASMGMMEARARVATNNTYAPVLSTQYIVSCSEYSQGCDGGFSYLAGGKFGQDFGHLEESCYVYEGVTSKCKDVTCDKKRLFVRNYRYIGGYFGALSTSNGHTHDFAVEQIQLEILRGGPVATDIMVYPDFQMYKGGVYTHTGLRSSSATGFNPFELTNHVVVIVGWGETDDGTPYWIVRNSWSASWGESGYVRVIRGQDMVAIESMPVAVDLDL